jgi:hypothetical protein
MEEYDKEIEELKNKKILECLPIINRLLDIKNMKQEAEKHLNEIENKYDELFYQINQKYEYSYDYW